ncbi:hypothetical protein [Streptomyces sp. TRM68367]|uniref:hypothetical protein n=1 Tax=Streptomyces sp. TRM68367 TaxID=2758415 RepID=UPI002934DA85|nr:hypothetical protein [Streptomyces sp. TRM68367]
MTKYLARPIDPTVLKELRSADDAGREMVPCRLRVPLPHQAEVLGLGAGLALLALAAVPYAGRAKGAATAVR